jgi:hypothetical protein
VSRPSFGAAGSGGLADCLTESFITLEEQMKEPHNKPELYSLSRGEGKAGVRLAERPLSIPFGGKCSWPAWLAAKGRGVGVAGGTSMWVG